MKRPLADPLTRGIGPLVRWDDPFGRRMRREAMKQGDIDEGYYRCTQGALVVWETKDVVIGIENWVDGE